MLNHMLLSATVGACLSGVLWVLRWVIARATPVRPGETRLPSNTAAMGMLSGAAAGLILGAGLVGSMRPGSEDFYSWLGLWLAFGAGGLWLTVAAGNWRLWLDETGMQVRDECGVVGPFTAWGDIVRVTPRWTSVIAFERRDGRLLKIPFGTDGLVEAVQASQAHGARLDAALRAELKALNDERLD